ncbi:MAG: DUF4126 domain-containing protein [Actinomycetota bacterium]
MLEVLTGSGLAMAAGLNAYIPLLALGLLSRYTDLLQLPVGWGWLESPAALVVLGVLLLVEVVADKVPAVDSINDVLQTVVRPAAGGMVFAAGSGSETIAVQDPAEIFQTGAWIPILLGIVLAFTTHTAKAIGRPIVNVSTAGAGGPVVSTAEDVSAVALVGVSVFLPLLVAVVLVVMVVAVVWLVSKWREHGRRPTSSSTY